MNSNSLKSIAGIILALMCMHANAEPFGKVLEDFRTAARVGKSSHQVDIDNDSLLLQRDDGFYTSGLRYTQHFTLHGPAQLTRFGWRLGQELYTPSNINLPPAQVGPPEHPYAGWLYGGVFKEIHRADGTHEKFGIDMGCLGPCAGGEVTQKTLHNLLDQPVPRAWSKQLKNEVGLVLHAESAPARWMLGRSVDITPTVYGRFGNIFTDAGASVKVRSGVLNLLPDQPTPHGFLRLAGRVVGYNATLQGGYFSKENPHTVKPKRLVGEAELGFEWNRAPYTIGASIIRRSNEIRDLSNAAGAQNFIRLQLSYTP